MKSYWRKIIFFSIFFFPSTYFSLFYFFNHFSTNFLEPNINIPQVYLLRSKVGVFDHRSHHLDIKKEKEIISPTVNIVMYI